MPGCHTCVPQMRFLSGQLQVAQMCVTYAFEGDDDYDDCDDEMMVLIDSVTSHVCDT